jgi:hypothetical protein
MRYQHKWDDVPLAEIPADNQANLEKTILRALELGINHIETARGYGTSEMQLGQLLPTLPREKMIIQTKVAPCEDPAEFLKTFDKSMDYLGLDHVELLSLHGINDEETYKWAMRKGGCIEAARKIQASGRAKFIGFSTHAPEHVITRAIETGEFDYVNLHWYFVNDLNWASVLAANKRDMGLFIISPNDKGGLLYKPSPKLKKLCEPLSPMIFNDLYCLARPQVHTLSIGAAKPEDFDEHIKALDYYDRIAATIAPIEKRLRAEMDSVLGKDWCSGWWRGIPEYTELPGEVNILEILRLWTFAKSLDLVDFAKMRYNLLGNAGHWFPGKNAAKFDPDEIVKAVHSNAFARRIPQILLEAHSLLHGEQQKRLSESE